MDLKWSLVLCLALGACSHKRGDPPPPASSVNLPAAPPGATGAQAAGLASAVIPTPGTPVPEDDSEEPPALPPGHPTLPGPGSGEEDAGVAL